MQLFCLQPKVQPEPQKGTSFLTLIKDPYVVLAASAITVANLGIGILEPSLPLWMMQRMDAKNFEQGAAFLPASISYLIGTNLFGPLGYRMGRWLASMIALFAIGFALLSVRDEHSGNTFIDKLPSLLIIIRFRWQKVLLILFCPIALLALQLVC